MLIFQIKSLIMAELIEQEGVSEWGLHLLEIVAWMVSTEEPAIINAACEAMCTIFQKTDDRMSFMCPKLLPAFYQVFTLPDVNNSIFGCNRMFNLF